MSVDPEPVAALNGRMVPLREARLAVVDDAIVQGATITERIRTFAHRPYLVAEHLNRLRWGLEQTGIADPDIVDGLPSLIDEVVHRNAGLIEAWQDLAIVIFVSPGWNPSLAMFVPPSSNEPTVCVHTTTLPPSQWAKWCRDGLRLVTPSVRHVPAESIDPRIKHRSRLHWFLAERQARLVDPEAVALLLNARGHVTETASGNVLVFKNGRLLTPHPQDVLGGISQQIVSEIADAGGIETMFADLTPGDLLEADEAFVTSTGYCLLPVTRLNGHAIGDGRPGPLWAKLLGDWSARVGVDILAQNLHALDDPL